MNTLKTYKTSSKIDKIINIGNGKYYYNFNIFPTKIKRSFEDTTIDGYSYNQVEIIDIPTYEKCVRAVIRAYISVDDEFDLINTANRALMGLLSEDEKTKALNEYNEYLNMVSNIKQKVRKDFEQ